MTPTTLCLVEGTNQSLNTENKLYYSQTNFLFEFVVAGNTKISRVTLWYKYFEVTIFDCKLKNIRAGQCIKDREKE